MKSKYNRLDPTRGMSLSLSLVAVLAATVHIYASATAPLLWYILVPFLLSATAAIYVPALLFSVIVTLAVLHITTYSFLLMCGAKIKSSPPNTPGFCWHTVVPENYRHRFSYNPEGWICQKKLKEILLFKIRYHKDPSSRFPFVRLISLGQSQYHILPYTSYKGRLIRVKDLPEGWYGAGSTDPNFYSDSPLRSVILSMHMGAYGKALDIARKECPYDVPSNLKPLLTEAGISQPPPHAPTHSHPVHYALRNKYMSLAAKSLQGEWYALFAGPDRINFLRSCGASAPVGAPFSPIYEGKDITRHMGQPIPAVKEPSSPAPVWYVCDALHHLSASTVGSWFDKNPKLEYVVATTIIPPETLWGLPSLCQILYTYSVKNNVLTYVPEGHTGSAYVQPVDGNRWLKTDALITPQNRCVHVSLLAQDYAHQLIVISRAPLLPQKSRLMCIRNVSIVPWFIHPLGSLYQRLTSPGLNRALQTYITRVGSTSIRDIYSKCSAHEVAVFNRYPQSFVRAGALYAKWLRDIDYHTASSGFTYVRWVLTMITRLPIIPFRWYFQSFTSIFSQMNQDEADLWEIQCSTWVSQTSDSLLPGLTAQVCPNKLEFFQLQPNADRLSRFAAMSAKLGAWLVLKVLGVISWPLISWCFTHFVSFVDVLFYMLDLHWNTSPGGIVFTILLFWFGVTGPKLSFPNFQFGFIRDFYYGIFVCLYQLPSQRHVYRVGVNWFYCILLNFSLVTLAFPHMHPIIFLLNRTLEHDHYVDGPVNLEPGSFFNITQVPVDIVHHPISSDIGYNWLRWSCYIVNILLLAAAYIYASGLFLEMTTDYEPIHDLEAHNDLSCGSICFHHTPSPVVAPAPAVVSTSTASGSGSSAPVNIVVPPPSPVPSLALPAPAVPILGNQPLPGTPPLAPQVLPALPAVVANDPLRAYNLPLRILGSFDNWRNLLSRQPVPPNQLDPNNSCVWDVLSSHLGIQGSVLWACYVSTLPGWQRARYAQGFVPAEDLSQVLNFFACTYTIYGGIANGICPRGPGAQVQPCVFNPAHPPHSVGAGLEGFPTFIAYIQNNQDGSFHFSNRGVARTGAGAFVPPAINDWIGWASRLVPDVEIGEVVNLPAKGFGTVYRRLLGTMANPLSMFPMGTRLQGYILPAVPVRQQIVTYVPNVRDSGYARALASDFKAKPLALDLTDFSPVDAARTLDQMAKQYDNFVRTGSGLQYPQVRFHLFHGVGGGGKSHTMIQDLVAQHAVTPFSPHDIMFHAWDHNLRSKFMSDVLAAFPQIGLQNNNFTSGCIPLIRPASGTVVFDDAGLMYNSYLPLFMAANPGVTDIWLTFDAAQGQGVIPTANAISRGHPATKDWLSPMSDHYGTEVIRWSQETADLYGFPRRVIPGRIAPRGQVVTVSQSPHNVPLLAVSPRFTQTQSMGGQVANTFQECQGHTINGDVCVDLGGLTATCTDTSAWTALTRPTGHTFLKMGPMMNTSAVVETSWAKSQILTALLTVATIRSTPYLTAAADVDGLVRTAVYSHLARNLSPGACAALGLPAPSPVIGSQGVKAEYRAGWLNNSKASDYYTARTHRAAMGVGGGAGGSAFSRHTAQITNDHSPVAHIVRHFTDLDPEAVLHVDSTGYHLPEPSPITAQPDPVDDINEPLDDVLREAMIPENQFETTFQHIVDGAPDALHHTRADKITDILGQRKRIRVGMHSAPWSTTDTKRLRALQKGFRKFFDVASWQAEGANGPLMEQCEREKLASWASKRTKKTLQQSIDKQDIDMQFTFTRLFPKGQYIKKKAKWRCNAFASQTVSDFHLGRIFRDAPRALYLEKQALKYAFDTTYLHCKASPDDMSRWYRQFWQPGIMTGNDYTAWDSGIDHVFLEFDLWLFDICGFPVEYMERFKFERLNTHSFLGNHMPRQESGDRWTWILNTLRNVALTGASLDCPPRTPLCVSGDDSVTLGAWRKTVGFNPQEWLMVPKREEGSTMEFCGLVFGGTDVSFGPAVVHWRSRFGLQQGRADADYWLSIKQAIIETSSKLGCDNTKLAGALLNLRRAILLFNLPSHLDIPDAPPEPVHVVETFVCRVNYVLRWFFWLV
ncbi:polyprotein [Sclerotinia sclerotiorum deltaflexivirus 1]|uniref:Polyprotein n=1 Tax=Sclerotinia sclerotiorum deltaflexivirus 1 TaxID=1788309 RepID=A0A125R919_9VIRU|nr:polyprotein [Sclerotinia sclerotiorum deltaflexivirus 1]AMD16208.1 polyprotein [Sclerotinia sclerotiorum deltaflexivirus 1]